MFSQKRADTTPTIELPHLPQVVPPSGVFDGNDGKWSTFDINVGDSSGNGNGQNFRVLVSTSSPLTLVPAKADWCNTECAPKRGIEIFNSRQSPGFDSTASTSWKELGTYEIPVLNWWSGSKPNGTWGLENVGLGQTDPLKSPILQEQMVVKYTAKELFMGSFGLAAGAVRVGSGPRMPFLPNFAYYNQTPSTSYGYTAGAFYQNNSKGVHGSLVLGGFDKSRFTEQGTSISMPAADNNTLLVGVQGITYQPNSNTDTGAESFTADRESSSGFYATIDSTLPYLFLPDDICDEFASKFRLTFDNNTGLYTVNDTAHDNNLRQNAAVTFKIGADSGDNSVNFTSIRLPYAAFDLQANSPLYAKPTNYFPIRKSPTGVYVLGRTFLQEAYIIVDYERLNFTVAPAVYSNPMPSPQIVSIFKKDYIPLGVSPTATPDKKTGLTPGAVAGIVVGIVILFLLLGVGAFFFWKKRRASKTQPKEEISEIGTMVDGMVDGTQDKQRRVSELDSGPDGKPAGGYYGNNGRNENKDVMPFPPISEMESPPAELYSPESAQLSAVTPSTERIQGDYFTKPRRRGATRESSQSGTPGSPGVPAIHELPGDDGQFQVGGLHFDRVESPPPERPVHSRGPSDSSIQTNIDGVISGSTAGVAGTATNGPTRPGMERRPSHARGASDTTIQSDTTAVSQPTPEEIENWAMGVGEPRRPLSE